MKTATHSNTKQADRTPAKKAPAAKAKAPHVSQSASAPGNGKRDELDRQRAESEGMTGTRAEPSATGAAGALEGEGSYTASREYREGVEQSVRKGDTDRLAEEAARALDGPEGASLRAAEKAGKQAAHH